MILQFLHVVWPIFAIAGMGWLWQRLGQPFDEKSISALVIQCAMPVAVFSYLFALRYGGPSDEVAGMILISTVLALALLPLILRVAA